MATKVLNNDLNLSLVSYYQMHKTSDLVKKNIEPIRTF